MVRAEVANHQVVARKRSRRDVFANGVLVSTYTKTSRRLLLLGDTLAIS
jgi:hypothetical protein